MSLTQKVDVLDLIINILREHEKELDHQISRLKNYLDGTEKDQHGGTEQ